MIIDRKPITLSVITVKLDGKKITNSLLDQIPRLDFCELLIDQDGCFDSSQSVIPICRFSLTSLLSSQARIYKSKLYNSSQIEKMMSNLPFQDEAFLFTYEGQIFCDSFSSRTATVQFGNQLSKLEKKVSNSNSKITSMQNTLEADSHGVKPIEIIKSKIAKESSDIWSHGIVDFDESEDDLASTELAFIMKQYSSWSAYIFALEQEMLLESNRKKDYEKDIQSFRHHVSNVIGAIQAAPFTILGL